MVKYREILRLIAMGVSQESVAFSCGCAQSTVSDVIRAARARGLSWPLPEEMDDAAIRSVIYPKRSRKATDKAAIDFEHVARELGRRGMTLSLLWNEYCDSAVSRGEEPYMARPPPVPRPAAGPPGRGPRPPTSACASTTGRPRPSRWTGSGTRRKWSIPIRANF